MSEWKNQLALGATGYKFHIWVLVFSDDGRVLFVVADDYDEEGETKGEGSFPCRLDSRTRLNSFWPKFERKTPRQISAQPSNMCYREAVGDKRHKGFSLLEVIVGTFIFLTALGAMQGYWITVSRMMEQSRARMAASFVAEQLMEDILAKGYERVDTIATSGELGLDVTMYGKPKHYAIKYKINIVDVNDDLKSVEVNLGSTGGRDLRFETLLAKSM